MLADPIVESDADDFYPQCKAILPGKNTRCLKQGNIVIEGYCGLHKHLRPQTTSTTERKKPIRKAAAKAKLALKNSAQGKLSEDDLQFIEHCQAVVSFFG